MFEINNGVNCYKEMWTCITCSHPINYKLAVCYILSLLQKVLLTNWTNILVVNSSLFLVQQHVAGFRRVALRCSVFEY